MRARVHARTHARTHAHVARARPCMYVYAQGCARVCVVVFARAQTRVACLAKTEEGFEDLEEYGRLAVD